MRRATFLVCFSIFATRAVCGAAANNLFELERQAFDFFWTQTNPTNGLTKDRAGNFAADHYQIASIASTGFGLAALPVGVERGWISRDEGINRARLTLSTFEHTLAHEHGWFYHFVNLTNGERAWRCEVSSIDTALFLAGALVAANYFGDDTRQHADAIYNRVDFEWMRTDGGARPEAQTLSMGWRPENGFIKARWDSYSEHLILGILALGSPTHPVPASTWTAWKRNTGEYKGHQTFACGPLFTHQYSQAFIDFRKRRDRDGSGFNYFDSAVEATLANRQFCIDQSTRFKTYSTNVWGLSACDAPGDRYEAFGAPPGIANDDGTVSPWNVAASVAFTPDLVLAAVNEMRTSFPRLNGRYGFASAFNLDRDWYAKDVIGIDLGAALLMIENYRSELIWKQIMATPAIRLGLQKAAFRTDVD